jgi:hypothetical protein
MNLKAGRFLTRDYTRSALGFASSNSQLCHLIPMMLPRGRASAGIIWFANFSQLPLS